MSRSTIKLSRSPKPSVALTEMSILTADIAIYRTTEFEIAMSCSSLEQNLEVMKENQVQCAKSANDMKRFNEPSERWLSYFNGFVSRNQPEFELRENRKCVILPANVTTSQIDRFLAFGVRCFIFDFFYGNEQKNIDRIREFRAREAHFNEHRQLPVHSTLIAQLTPRQPFTGQLEHANASHFLHKGHQMVLTTSRYFSLHSTATKVYINAGYVFSELKPFDIVLLGHEIQFLVKRLHERAVYGEVIQGGTLKSRMPVRFPMKCVDHCRPSIEEIRDIAMARELNISIALVPNLGNMAFYESLRDIVDLLDAQDLRLFATLKPNGLLEAGDQYDWLLDSYDGFFIQYQQTKKDATCYKPELLMLCPAVSNLLTRIYESTKPILLDPTPFLDRRLLPQQEHYRHIFYEPDKFVLTPASFEQAHRFDIIAEQYMHAAVRYELSRTLCDKSYTGINALAKAISCAAYEVNASVVILYSEHGEMASILSNFRINFPIVLVSPVFCLCNYMSVYFNVIPVHATFMQTEKFNALSAHGEHAHAFKSYPTYHQRVAKSIMHALDCARQLKLIRDTGKAILAYSMWSGTKLPDKYAIYQLHEKSNDKDLQKQLFNCTCLGGKCIESNLQPAVQMSISDNLLYKS